MRARPRKSKPKSRIIANRPCARCTRRIMRRPSGEANMNKSLFYSVFLSAVLAGCSTGPEYRRPAAELPNAWQAVPAQGQAVSGERWWTLYGDATLTRLVDEALANNQDLALAAARLDEARALARIADAELVPSVDAGFQRDRPRRSHSTATRVRSEGTPPHPSH